MLVKAGIQTILKPWIPAGACPGRLKQGRE